MIAEPTLKQLDEMRTTGYRPTVVVCCLHDKKVLLLFKKDYRLWMLPQSGVNTRETPARVALTVLKEEMGDKFVANCAKVATYLGDDQVEFLPEKQTNEEMETEDGKSFKIIGKHYYFYAVEVKTEEFDLAQTVYDESYWFDSKPGLVLASKIYQPGKRRITMKALNLLQENNLIS
jgi:hypothetical protein